MVIINGITKYRKRAKELHWFVNSVVLDASGHFNYLTFISVFYCSFNTFWFCFSIFVQLSCLTFVIAISLLRPTLFSFFIGFLTSNFISTNVIVKKKFFVNGDINDYHKTKKFSIFSLCHSTKLMSKRHVFYKKENKKWKIECFPDTVIRGPLFGVAFCSVYIYL